MPVAYFCEHLCGIMCDTRLTAEEVMHGTDSLWLPPGYSAPKKKQCCCAGEPSTPEEAPGTGAVVGGVK